MERERSGLQLAAELKDAPRNWLLAVIVVGLAGLPACGNKKVAAAPPPAPSVSRPEPAPLPPAGPVSEPQTEAKLPPPQPIPPEAIPTADGPLSAGPSATSADPTSAPPGTTSTEPLESAATEQVTEPPEEMPLPQLGQILSPDERRSYNLSIDESIEQAQRSLADVVGEELTPDQNAAVRRIRAFIEQATEARTQDLTLAKNLADRARLLAEDLAKSLP